MKKAILLFSFLISTVSLAAQSDSVQFSAPDYAGIKQITADPDSEFYYPKLMARMVQNDTTLTIAHYRALYYGYIYQPAYSPFSIPDEENELMKYYQGSMGRTRSKKKCNDIIRLIEQALESDPFYLRGRNFLGYTLHLKGEEEKALQTAMQFRMIISAILSSGDGESPESAFHVIHAGHEYVVMNLFGLQYGTRETRNMNNGKCDCFTLDGKNRICFFVPYGVMELHE